MSGKEWVRIRWGTESPESDEENGNGAGDRTRTGDVQLGKLTFYH